MCAHALMSGPADRGRNRSPPVASASAFRTPGFASVVVLIEKSDCVNGDIGRARFREHVGVRCMARVVAAVADEDEHLPGALRVVTLAPARRSSRRRAPFDHRGRAPRAPPEGRRVGRRNRSVRGSGSRTSSSNTIVNSSSSGCSPAQRRARPATISPSFGRMLRAVVDHEAHGNRRVLGGEQVDVLPAAVVENDEMIARQIGDELSVLVGDGHRQHDQLARVAVIRRRGCWAQTTTIVAAKSAGVTIVVQTWRDGLRLAARLRSWCARPRPRDASALNRAVERKVARRARQLSTRRCRVAFRRVGSTVRVLAIAGRRSCRKCPSLQTCP